uniref:EB domain-containing protein n=1 Tax=Ascaris lumbricoides TaxID=6252 RepID=A0A0M3HNM8_ASCLU
MKDCCFVLPATQQRGTCSCADQAVLCEQLCIAISSEAYECGCWDGHVLLGDGLGCIGNFDNATVDHISTMTKVYTVIGV